MSNKTEINPPQFSAEISAFCRMMEDAVKDYTYCQEEVGRMDHLTQDYLHTLELDDLKYKERARVATKIAECRQTRRACKDTTEILEPLVTFLQSEKGKNMMNLMREALGKTRKVEERMQTRRYYNRVMTEAERKEIKK